MTTETDPRAYLAGGRRLAVEASHSLDDWWVGVSPRNGYGALVEGPWDDWVILAKKILAADAEHHGGQPTTWSTTAEREALAAQMEHEPDWSTAKTGEPMRCSCGESIPEPTWDALHMHRSEAVLAAGFRRAEALAPTGDDRVVTHPVGVNAVPAAGFRVSDPFVAPVAGVYEVSATGLRLVRAEVPEPSTEGSDWPDHLTTNEKLRDLHARWHDQPGNLIEVCEWEGCEFWEVAKFTLRMADVRVIGREPQAEPSDAEIEAAAQAMFEPDGPGVGEYTWAEMVVEDPSRADIWRADARRVLAAVRGTGGDQ